MFAHRVPVLALALWAAWGSAAWSQGPGRGQRHFEDITGDLPNEPVTAVAVDASSPDTIYAGLDGFLFKSVDGGEAWRPVLSFPRGIALDDTDAELVVDDGTGDEALPDGSVDAVADPLAVENEEGGIVVTTDGEDDEELPAGDVIDVGDTTAFARESPGVRAIVIVPGSADVMYVATARGMYRSVNRGASFDRLVIPGGARENDVRDIAVDPSKPSRLYVATAGGLLVSKDGGTSFVSAGGTVGHTPCLAVAAEILGGTDPSAVYGTVGVLVGTVRGLYRSNDGGDRFLEVILRGLPPVFPVPAVAIAPNSENFFAGTAQGLFVGERNAALLERYPGVPSTLVQSLLPDTIRRRGIVIGTRTRGVLFSSDAGILVEENAEQVPAGEVFSMARSAKAPDDIVVATDRGIFRSRPGTGVTISAGALKKLREMWSKEPGLDETARRAVAYARLGGDTLYSMQARAGAAKWLPRLDALFVGTVGRTERREQFLLRAGDDLPPGLDPDNDQTDLFGNIGAFVIQPAEGVSQVFFVRLTWDLDKIIFNRDQIAVMSRYQNTSYGAERRVIESVREAWIARRRLMAEIALGDAPRGQDAAVKAAQRELRLQELTAQLDGATGGAFSQPNQTMEDSR